MDVNERDAKIDSEMANADVAVGKAMELMMEFLDNHRAVPALKHVSESQMRAIMFSHRAGLSIAVAVEPGLGQTMALSLMTSFLAGVEWGKANRELYNFEAECNEADCRHAAGRKKH
jgi:hypothetical protein